MRIVIVGGGASGMMCAIAAAKFGSDVTLLEKNEKLGKKIYITGKGRCNVINFCSAQEFLNNVVSNEKFLFSAINKFSPYDTYDFFQNYLPLKIERGNRVFPESDKSSDVIKSLEKAMTEYGVKVVLNCCVNAVKGSEFDYKIYTDCGEYVADRVVIATGGKSYPSTGSTGDGYKIAKSFGLKLIDPKPALCPIITKQAVKEIEGITLKNVELSAYSNGKLIRKEFGEMLFTANGVSGPIALTISSFINREKNVLLKLDFKPALNFETLDARIVRELNDPNRKVLKSVIRSLLPERLVRYLLRICNLSGDKPTSQVTKSDRICIVNTLKGLEFDVQSLAPFEQAIITSGGIAVDELTPQMESRKRKGLFFVGETVDVDALTGGFNLQIAFSTGYVAALKASQFKG